MTVPEQRSVKVPQQEAAKSRAEISTSRAPVRRMTQSEWDRDGFPHTLATDALAAIPEKYFVSALQTRYDV